MEDIYKLDRAKANEANIETGIRYRRSIIESQGRDFDKHVPEIKKERQLFLDKAVGNKPKKKL